MIYQMTYHLRVHYLHHHINPCIFKFVIKYIMDVIKLKMNQPLIYLLKLKLILLNFLSNIPSCILYIFFLTLYKSIYY